MTSIFSGYSTDQSESEPEPEEVEDDDEEDIGAVHENELNVRTDYELLHVHFENGITDSKYFNGRFLTALADSLLEFRYDGSIVFHLRAPSRAMSCRLESDSCVIRTFTWKLILMVKANSDPLRHEGTLGLFLACEPEVVSTNWSILARTEFTILHATDPTQNCVKSKRTLVFHSPLSLSLSLEEMHHTFSTRTIDWGYENFLTLKVGSRKTLLLLLHHQWTCEIGSVEWISTSARQHDSHRSENSCRSSPQRPVSLLLLFLHTDESRCISGGIPKVRPASLVYAISVRHAT